MNIAVIPARGGSKRIPRKNIKLFGGLPMVAWSIRAAHQSRCFDRIIVSTDDAEISEIALFHGAEVPFVRPAELSDDYTGTVPVVAHAIQWHITRRIFPTQVCCIYATAPFLRASDLCEGLKILRESNADYALSVTNYAFPIQRAVRITPNNRVNMFQPEHYQTRSQDLEDAWHDAGQFYWGRTDAWLAEKPLLGPGSVPVALPRYRVQDIDTPEDWKRAELMFRALDQSEITPCP